MDNVSRTITSACAVSARGRSSASAVVRRTKKGRR